MYIYQNPKKIAILMAVYNAESYIEEQIDSIINQSNKEWTLYIRDDLSTDKTIKIVKTYLKKHDNIILVKDNKGNLGCKYNFFELLESVNSSYYMFSDADDYWLSDKIAICFEKIKFLEDKNPQLPIVIHTDVCVADEQLNIIEQSMWHAAKFNPDKIKNYNYLGLLGYVGGATMLFNQKAKEVSLPIHPDVYMHDLWIGLCVIQKGIVHSIHQSTLLYRQHTANSVGGACSAHLSITYKMKNFRKVLNANWQTYRMLHRIGYGSILKYFYYKTKLVLMMRNGQMFK